MNPEQTKEKVAQPANEEIKKHGDLLEKQVRDAATSTPDDSRNDNGKNPVQHKN